MSRPSKTILPAVGSSSLMIVRPSVVFPQPDSPTMPSVSPCRTLRSTPSTARTCPTVCLKTPALIGKCLTRPSTRRISSPFADAHGWRRHRRLRVAHEAAPTRGSTGRELLGEVARGQVIAAFPTWRSSGTSVRQIARPSDKRAARVERAARRRRDQARRLTRDRLEPLRVRVDPREAVHQADRVRVARRVEDREDVAELDDAARVHHDDAVGELGDQAEVVRDQDDRRVRLPLSRLQHLDDLRLDRHVERRRRLVGDEDARVVRDRHRDHRALAHAAGELVRVLVDAPLGDGHADELEQLDRALRARRRRSVPGCAP